MPTPDFIVSLRDKIGHDPLWLCGVTAVVLRDGEAGQEVLLVRRADNGRWTPTCGIVEPGEHPAEAAVREVLEEAGVACRVDGLSGVGVTPPATYPNGDRVQFIDHTFRCSFVAGEPRAADDESVDAGWFPVDAAPVTARFRARILEAAAYDGTTRLRTGAEEPDPT